MKSATLRVFALTAFLLVGGSWFALHLVTPQRVQAQSNRVFEMRTYHTNPGRMPALETLFRDHALKLFERHGISHVGYWVAQDTEDTFVYIVAHSSRDQAKKSWDSFRADPDWQKANSEADAEGKIVNKIEIVFLDPLDFSPLK